MSDLENELKTVDKEMERLSAGRPRQWKHHHKYPAAWARWSSFVKWVFTVWPRNP
jgi:hypothetical protein